MHYLFGCWQTMHFGLESVRCMIIMYFFSLTLSPLFLTPVQFVLWIFWLKNLFWIVYSICNPMNNGETWLTTGAPTECTLGLLKCFTKFLSQSHMSQKREKKLQLVRCVTWNQFQGDNVIIKQIYQNKKTFSLTENIAYNR